MIKTGRPLIYGLLILAVLTSCTQPAMKLKRVRDAYIGEITKCMADNHTLVNKKEVEAFLQGNGKAEVQTLTFVSNKQLDAWGVSAGAFGIELGTEFNLEGESVNSFPLRRKLINQEWAFKVDEGRALVPSALSSCEKLRTRWALIDKSLTYEFFKD